jgi:hypothetical protein
MHFPAQWTVALPTTNAGSLCERGWCRYRRTASILSRKGRWDNAASPSSPTSSMAFAHATSVTQSGPFIAVILQTIAGVRQVKNIRQRLQHRMELWTMGCIKALVDDTEVTPWMMSPSPAPSMHAPFQDASIRQHGTSPTARVAECYSRTEYARRRAYPPATCR